MGTSCSAAVLSYTTDGAGITLGTATITGGFDFDTDTNLYSAVAFTVTGAGARDGSYTLSLAVLQTDTFLVAVRTGSGPDLDGADSIALNFAQSLDLGGTTGFGTSGLGDCGGPTCSLGILDNNFLGTPSGSVTAGGEEAVVPLPAALPLLAGALAALGLVRRKSRR